MAPTRQRQERPQISADSALAGILALLVDEREQRLNGDDRKPPKTEILLANAGLSVDDIVALVDKKPDAIRKSIQRGRAK